MRSVAHCDRSPTIFLGHAGNLMKKAGWENSAADQFQPDDYGVERPDSSAGHFATPVCLLSFSKSCWYLGSALALASNGEYIIKD